MPDGPSLAEIREVWKWMREPMTITDNDYDDDDDDAVFVIHPETRRFRYLFNGGNTMDVESPYSANSTDRDKVLIEAQRRWGGKKDDWQIAGVTTLR